MGVQELAVELGDVDTTSESDADDWESENELKGGVDGEPFLKGKIGTEVASGD